MVQSSYKNRKKNRKQSFKRKNTDGNRKVKFIDDDDKKMVGGDANKQAVAALMLKYKVYPLSGLVLAAFSNADCASEDECGALASDRSHLSTLKKSVIKCEAILNALPDIDGKPEIKSWIKDKDLEFITYLDDCIGYILKNAFIPKDLIQHVYVQKDEGSWTTLKNNNFNKVESETLGKRDAAVNAKANITEQLKGEEEEEKEDTRSALDKMSVEINNIVQSAPVAGGGGKLPQMKNIAKKGFDTLYHY